ncbi:JAB domain-containing protein [Lichenicola sp.]|uniref:JAB domain-containing protein n=1 Tax=Lichenicola sp. TaxID=2804529 RepID=UPI003B00E217
MSDGFADAGSLLIARPIGALAGHLPPTALLPVGHEVLLTLLKRVMPACDHVERLADDALARSGSLAGLLASPLRELRGIAGFGTHSLSALKLLHEAALRLARARMLGCPILSDRAVLLDYLTSVLARERIEQFRVLFLDEGDRLLSDEAQARGTVNHTPVYPREVARRAIELAAHGLILVHNHPSGDPTPSPEDLAMTKRVVEACTVMRIVVNDHLIVGNARWISFRDEGLLD